MQIITIASQKGGVGKTTLSQNLAVAASLDDVPTIIIDIDPQGSAAAYYDRRLGNGHPEQPKTVSVQPVRLPQVLEDARADGYKLAIIDTPPAVQGTLISVVNLSDMVLMPVQPSMIDLEAVKATTELVLNNCPIAAVLNGCKHFGEAAKQARQYIEQIHELPVLDQGIGDRQAFRDAATSGQGVIEIEPASHKACQEVAGVWAWVKSALKQIAKADAAERKEAHG